MIGFSSLLESVIVSQYPERSRPTLWSQKGYEFIVNATTGKVACTENMVNEDDVAYAHGVRQTHSRSKSQHSS